MRRGQGQRVQSSCMCAQRASVCEQNECTWREEEQTYAKKASACRQAKHVRKEECTLEEGRKMTEQSTERSGRVDVHKKGEYLQEERMQRENESWIRTGRQVCLVVAQGE